MGKERIKYIAALLLSLTVWYQCCTTLFSHTHTIGSYRITHSHPYTGTSDNPCHSHTAAQFLTIALLSAFTALAAMLAGAAAAAPETGRLLRHLLPCGTTARILGRYRSEALQYRPDFRTFPHQDSPFRMAPCRADYRYHI